MKLLITGSRDWESLEHFEIIHRELSKFPAGTILVHGACGGVDTIAALIARELRFVVRDYPADWDRYGPKAAGMIRNHAMLKAEHLPEEPVDLVLAFHEDIENSRGTKGMVRIAKKASVPTLLFSS